MFVWAESSVFSFVAENKKFLFTFKMFDQKTMFDFKTLALIKSRCFWKWKDKFCEDKKSLRFTDDYEEILQIALSICKNKSEHFKSEIHEKQSFDNFLHYKAFCWGEKKDVRKLAENYSCQTGLDKWGVEWKILGCLKTRKGGLKWIESLGWNFILQNPTPKLNYFLESIRRNRLSSPAENQISSKACKD